MNVNIIADYGKHLDAGLDYLMLHEMSHMTKVNQDFDAVAGNPQDLVEQMASAIARAITHAAGIPILPGSGPAASGGGYGTTDPLVFEIPSPD